MSIIISSPSAEPYTVFLSEERLLQQRKKSKTAEEGEIRGDDLVSICREDLLHYHASNTRRSDPSGALSTSSKWTLETIESVLPTLAFCVVRQTQAGPSVDVLAPEDFVAHSFRVNELLADQTQLVLTPWSTLDPSATGLTGAVATMGDIVDFDRTYDGVHAAARQRREQRGADSKKRRRSHQLAAGEEDLDTSAKKRTKKEKVEAGEERKRRKEAKEEDADAQKNERQSPPSPLSSASSPRNAMTAGQRRPALNKFKQAETYFWSVPTPRIKELERLNELISNGSIPIDPRVEHFFCVKCYQLPSVTLTTACCGATLCNHCAPKLPLLSIAGSNVRCPICKEVPPSACAHHPQRDVEVALLARELSVLYHNEMEAAAIESLSTSGSTRHGAAGAAGGGTVSPASPATTAGSAPATGATTPTSGPSGGSPSAFEWHLNQGLLGSSGGGSASGGTTGAGTTGGGGGISSSTTSDISPTHGSVKLADAGAILGARYKNAGTNGNSPLQR